ncbi:RNA polymerase subunit sigma [Sphingomonas sp. Leaf231]|uniref:sigma-70 family RNA polymerase sigma factor n=1 Tax=Sphingomonas sp. Leaf231 TaxID=1736301 RepID=UPI0006FF3910|nr:sigma-70 family RNA polymerase sigma factor [Sphingomonas sp. Leaf231]KQN93160.1 RNA polymerase subunit sigma [Sphingomonas sp. Leaf231]
MTVADTDRDEARAALVRALLHTALEDRAAFRQLYAMTSAKLFGICLRICGERQAAEDVLQDVYVQVWRRAGAFEPGRASPITWLATIARNRALDWRRAHARAPFAGGAAMPEIADPATGAEQGLLDADEGARLRACLEQLEVRQRHAIRTAFYEGVTYAELALREAVPLATMKSMVRRALIRLRGCLSDDA